MLRIALGVHETQSASVPIRWCVSRDTLAKLKKKGVLNVHVLVVIRPEDPNDGRREARYLFPLEQELGYVAFRRPGKNRVFAALVWPDPSEKRSALHDRFLAMHDGRWKTTVVSADGEKFLPGYGEHAAPDWAPMPEIAGSDEEIREELQRWHLSGWDDLNEIVNVEVPRELFAKEPSEREKVWVNRYFDEPAVDECAFRRRRLFAYTIQPFLVAVIAVVSALIGTLILILSTAVGILLGVRIAPQRFTFWEKGWVWDPEVILPKDYFPLEGERWNPWLPIWPRGIQIKKETRYLAVLEFLGRPTYFVAILAITLFSVWPTTPGSLIEAFLWATLGFASLLLVLAIADASWITISSLNEAVKGWRKRREERHRVPEVAPSEIEFLYNEYETLACSGLELVPSLRAIAPKRRTFYLRFQAVKAAVCRPFSN